MKTCYCDSPCEHNPPVIVESSRRRKRRFQADSREDFEQAGVRIGRAMWKFLTDSEQAIDELGKIIDD